MRNKPTDPESYLTEELLSSRSPSDTVEQRLGSVSGKHQYESCMIKTYRLTKKYLDNRIVIPESERLKHLYALKAEILHYCIPHKLNWKDLINDGLGNLIVKPNYKNDIYYRYLAFNLFLIEPRQVSRYLDFHLVHAVLKPFHSKSSSILTVKQLFLKQVDFTVMHMIDNNMAIRQTEVSDAIYDWVRKEMDKFTADELLEYHDYAFDPSYKFGLQYNHDADVKPLYAGCSDELVVEYFNLLTNNSDNGYPFMTKAVVRYLVCRWFGIGEDADPPQDIIHINTSQMVFFVREFFNHFQIHPQKEKRSLTQKEFFQMLEKDLPFLFVNVEASTLYKKINHYAKQGEHPKLDWRNSKKLSSSIGK